MTGKTKKGSFTGLAAAFLLGTAFATLAPGLVLSAAENRRGFASAAAEPPLQPGPEVTPARADAIVGEELDALFARRFIGADKILDPIRWVATDKLSETKFSSVLSGDAQNPVVYYDARLGENEFRHAVRQHFNRLLFLGSDGVAFPPQPLGLRRSGAAFSGQQCGLCFYTYTGDALESHEETPPQNFIDWARRQENKKPAP